MAVQYFNPKQYEKLKQLYIKRKLTFEEVTTQKKKYLKLGTARSYLSANPEEEEELSPESLGLIMKAKKEVLKNYDRLGPFEDCLNLDAFSGIRRPYRRTAPDQLAYIFDKKVSSVLGPRIEPARPFVAIDLSGAYITTAKNLGLLSESTWNNFYIEERDKAERKRKKNKPSYRGHAKEIYKHSKLCRLIALGILATKKSIVKYTGGEEDKEAFREEYSPEEANIFYKVAKETGRIMAEACEKFEGDFYFVDCVWVPEDKAEAASDWLKEKGYLLNTKSGFLAQNGCSFEFFYPDKETGEELKKEYFLSPGKSLSLREEFDSPLWLENFVKDIKLDKDLSGWLRGEEGEERKEAAKKIVAKKIIGEFPFLKNFDSITEGSLLQLKFIAKECTKLGFAFSELFSLTASIGETRYNWGAELPLIAAYVKILDKDIFKDDIRNGLPELYEEGEDASGLPYSIGRSVNLEVRALGDDSSPVLYDENGEFLEDGGEEEPSKNTQLNEDLNSVPF